MPLQERFVREAQNKVAQVYYTVKSYLGIIEYASIPNFTYFIIYTVYNFNKYWGADSDLCIKSGTYIYNKKAKLNYLQFTKLGFLAIIGIDKFFKLQDAKFATVNRSWFRVFFMDFWNVDQTLLYTHCLEATTNRCHLRY